MHTIYVQHLKPYTIQQPQYFASIIQKIHTTQSLELPMSSVRLMFQHEIDVDRVGYISLIDAV